MTKLCSIADALATGLYAMGLEKAKEFIIENKNLSGYILYKNTNNKIVNLFLKSKI